MTPAPMIELRRVVKTYKNAAGSVTVLKGVDLTLYQGEFVAIVGKSGSGKSTLLNMVTGIDHPTAGQVVVGGTDLYRMNESQRSLWRGRHLGIVFQFFQLLPMLSLLENVMLPMDYVNYGVFEDRPARALALLRQVGLEAQAYKHPDAVSTGQQQSAAIARALATDPPVIVADEPTGNLDSRSAEVIIDLFTQLARAGKTIAMVTHDPSLTARVDRTIVIVDGELIDETVARAWPALPHRHFLTLTRQLQRRTLAAGAGLWAPGAAVEQVALLVAGELELYPAGPGAARRLTPGASLGLAEALHGRPADHGARASGPAELVLVDRTVIQALAAEAPAAWAGLTEPGT